MAAIMIRKCPNCNVDISLETDKKEFVGMNGFRFVCPSKTCNMEYCACGAGHVGELIVIKPPK